MFPATRISGWQRGARIHVLGGASSTGSRGVVRKTMADLHELQYLWQFKNESMAVSIIM